MTIPSAAMKNNLRSYFFESANFSLSENYSRRNALVRVLSGGTYML